MSTAKYFNLNTSAMRRLEMMREALKTHADKYPQCPESMKPKTWRDIRGTTHKSVAMYCGQISQGYNDKTPVWYCHTGAQFRDEKFTDQCEGGPEHTGWFSDPDCLEKIRGIVGRLPHGRFIAGYFETMGSCRVYYPEVFDSESEAAKSADYWAEMAAERERTYREKTHETEEAQEGLENSLQRLRECVALRNIGCMRYVRNEIAGLVETIRHTRALLASEYADFI